MAAEQRNFEEMKKKGSYRQILNDIQMKSKMHDDMSAGGTAAGQSIKSNKSKPYKSNNMMASFYDGVIGARNTEASEPSASFKIRNTNKNKPNI